MEKETDHCTWFFENWVRWTSYVTWEVFPLSELCKEHDKNCSSTVFFNLLFTHRVVGGLPIGIAAAFGCWYKYRKKMWSRL